MIWSLLVEEKCMFRRRWERVVFDHLFNSTFSFHPSM